MVHIVPIVCVCMEHVQQTLLTTLQVITVVAAQQCPNGSGFCATSVEQIQAIVKVNAWRNILAQGVTNAVTLI